MALCPHTVCLLCIVSWVSACCLFPVGSSTVSTSFTLLREAEGKLREVVRTGMADAMAASDHVQVERSVASHSSL